MNQIIKNTITDLVSNFLYYDRKEDEDLPLGVIEAMINCDEITPYQIVDEFQKQLLKGLGR